MSAVSGCYPYPLTTKHCIVCVRTLMPLQFQLFPSKSCLCLCSNFLPPTPTPRKRSAGIPAVCECMDGWGPNKKKGKGAGRGLVLKHYSPERHQPWIVVPLRRGVCEMSARISLGWKCWAHCCRLQWVGGLHKSSAERHKETTKGCSSRGLKLWGDKPRWRGAEAWNTNMITLSIPKGAVICKIYLFSNNNVSLVCQWTPQKWIKSIFYFSCSLHFLESVC